MGYDPTQHAPEFQQHLQGKDFLYKEDEALKKRAVGFGVGIFEDEDDDIYYGGPENTYSKTIMDDEEEYPQLKSKNTKPKKENKSSIKTGFDGKPALVGFMFSAKIQAPPEWFAPISLPKGWTCKPPFGETTFRKPKSVFNQKLSTSQRGKLLGEEALKGPSFQETLKSAPSVPRDFNFESLPPVNKQSALSALGGFTPFGDDPSKQLRYKRFLQVKAELEKDYIQPPPVPNI